MVAHQHWLPWINNPTSRSVTSRKLEQGISSSCLSSKKASSSGLLCPMVGLSMLCLVMFVSSAALSVLYYKESDHRSGWRNLLFDYQNISRSFNSLTEANVELREEHLRLQEQTVWLDQQNKLLNRTSARLASLNLDLSLEKTEMMEQIVNLSSSSEQVERLVWEKSELEEEMLNMTQSMEDLEESNTKQEEEVRRLSEVSNLLREELTRLRTEREELLEISQTLQGEIQNRSECEEAWRHNQQLQERVSDLQDERQNLSRALMEERLEAERQESSWRQELERRVEDMQSVLEAFQSLDRTCPVVNNRTKERICRKCPDSWRQFKDKCYYFSSRLLTWSSSRAWCQTQGGDLLVIHDEPEQSFIFDGSQSPDQRSSRLWIGMSDEEEEGRWLWVDGSSVASHEQFWLSRPETEGEPDDWKLTDPLGEDCGHIDTDESTLGSWMDGSCTQSYRWICEKHV